MKCVLSLPAFLAAVLSAFPLSSVVRAAAIERRQDVPTTAIVTTPDAEAVGVPNAPLWNYNPTIAGMTVIGNVVILATGTGSGVEATSIGDTGNLIVGGSDAPGVNDLLLPTDNLALIPGVTATDANIVVPTEAPATAPPVDDIGIPPTLQAPIVESPTVGLIIENPGIDNPAAPSPDDLIIFTPPGGDAPPADTFETPTPAPAPINDFQPPSNIRRPKKLKCRFRGGLGNDVLGEQVTPEFTTTCDDEVLGEQITPTTTCDDEVLGEEITPTTTCDDEVLGEEFTPDETTECDDEVLGEEITPEDFEEDCEDENDVLGEFEAPTDDFNTPLFDDTIVLGNHDIDFILDPQGIVLDAAVTPAEIDRQIKNHRKRGGKRRKGRKHD